MISRFLYQHMAWDKTTRIFYPFMHQYMLEHRMMGISMKRKKTKINLTMFNVC